MGGEAAALTFDADKKKTWNEYYFQRLMFISASAAVAAPAEPLSVELTPSYLAARGECES